MTCEEHRELEREREDARRELEGLPAEAPAPATVPNSPYPPPAPVVDDAGNVTVSVNLRGGR